MPDAATFVVPTATGRVVATRAMHAYDGLLRPGYPQFLLPRSQKPAPSGSAHSASHGIDILII